MVAMVEEPEAVERLVQKCEVLLTTFLDDYFRLFPSANASHCPAPTWAPAPARLATRASLWLGIEVMPESLIGPPSSRFAG
jgi:hypothetical protein